MWRSHVPKGRTARKDRFQDSLVIGRTAIVDIIGDERRMVGESRIVDDRLEGRAAQRVEAADEDEPARPSVNAPNLTPSGSGS